MDLAHTENISRSQPVILSEICVTPSAEISYNTDMKKSEVTEYNYIDFLIGTRKVRSCAENDYRK
jgi:hypothetical protein